MIRIILTTAFFCLVAAELKLLVLHTNDMHSRFLPTDRISGICESQNPNDCYGGMARVAAVAKKKKEEAKYRGVQSIFLNAGDTFQGTPYYTFYKWAMAADVTKLMGFDVMAFGNHEFDDGVDGLVPFIKAVNTPQVCANIDISLEPDLNQPGLTKSVVLERGGHKIAVIGYLSPDTKLFSNTGQVIFQDEITAIREECKRLKKKGVKIFIALGHSGYTREKEMAMMIEDIDVIVGGHSHTFLYTPAHDDGHHMTLDTEAPKGPYPTLVTQPSGKVVPVVQAYFATKYLGHIELLFDDHGDLKEYKGSPILLTGDMPEDKQIVNTIKPYSQKIADTLHAVVGSSKTTLDNYKDKCKIGECNVGNIICDSYIDYVVRHVPVTQGRTLAAIALNQAGGIKGSINTSDKEGAITLEDVMTVLPWGKKVVIHTITGKSLLEALEFSVALYEHSVEGHVSEFLQVAGLRVTYDMNKPPQQRVVSAKAVCTDCVVPRYYPVDPEKEYKVIMPEYIASGGDGFLMLRSITDPIVLPKEDYMILSEYISNHSPVYPAVEERIQLIGDKEALQRGAAAQQASNPNKRNMALTDRAAALVMLAYNMAKKLLLGG